MVAAVYGDHHLDIEYTDTHVTLRQICADAGAPRSVILRDRDLVTPEDDACAFAHCTA